VTTELPDPAEAPSTVVVRDQRLTMLKPAIGLCVFGVTGIVLMFDDDSPARRGIAVAGVLALILGGLFLVIALANPVLVTLSADGLAVRTRSGTHTMPAGAIQAVGLTRSGSVPHLTLWYDVDLVVIAIVDGRPPVWAYRSLSMVRSGRSSGPCTSMTCRRVLGFLAVMRRSRPTEPSSLSRPTAGSRSSRSVTANPVSVIPTACWSTRTAR
jgi:hypothetical protein